MSLLSELRKSMKINKKNILVAIFYAILVCCLSACSKDDAVHGENAEMRKIRVAVLVDDDSRFRWERTAKWALQNIDEAQRGMKNKVAFELEFYNQDSETINEDMEEIAKDTSIVAVIGPTTSASATQMALKLNSKKAYRKPMITPSATRTEYQRKFADVPFVWNLAESDISQLEVLIASIAKNELLESVSLLASDDGNDYSEWFGFIAEEYGLPIGGIYLYKTAEDIKQYVRQFCGTNWRHGAEALIFNPSSSEDAFVLDQEMGKIKEEIESEQARKYFYSPDIYCSDAFVSDSISTMCKVGFYQGVDLYAMPESGFGQAYQQLFGEDLINGEAQFYDAICLLAYSATLSYYTKQSLNEAILSVVNGREGKGSSWLPYDMSRNFQRLSTGGTPDIDGVSSRWIFDEQTHSAVVESSFRHWVLYDGEYVTIEYVSTDGSKRTSSSKNIWDWTASKIQGFDKTTGNDLKYPKLDDNWALLIAASKGWENYRFQADVFAMYQILKQHGYDDDHIVLICEDDLVTNKYNPEPNVLRVSDDGANLYDSSAIDYKLGGLSPEDIGDILQGRRSERLPHTLQTDENDNVFIFWSGHGSNSGYLDFGGDRCMTYEQMRSHLAATPHRKLLFAIEACYSGGLGKHCEGLPGVLFITAASPNETSRASVWSNVLHVYRSNGFTRGFQEAIESNSSISLRDLYYHLARSTSGSHVKVYNTACYGSVYDNTMAEFLNCD